MGMLLGGLLAQTFPSFSEPPINLPNNPVNVADLILTDPNSCDVVFTSVGGLNTEDEDGTVVFPDMWLIGQPDETEAAKYQARGVLLEINQGAPSVAFEDSIATEQPDGIWRGWQQIFRFRNVDGITGTGNALVRFEFRRVADLALMGRFTCQFNVT